MQSSAIRVAGSTNKRIILYRWDRIPTPGFVNAVSYVTAGHLEWVTEDGRHQLSPLEECKALCFVSESAKPDLFSENTQFERRPKQSGLWVRFFFRDDSTLDGLLSPNLVEWPESGYVVVPPQARANRQKVFIPKRALVRTEVQGAIGGAVSRERSKGTKPTPGPPGRQLTIFDS